MWGNMFDLNLLEYNYVSYKSGCACTVMVYKYIPCSMVLWTARNDEFLTLILLCLDVYFTVFTNMSGFDESCNLGKDIVMFPLSFPMFLYFHFQFHFFISGKESHLVFLYCFSKYSHCSLLNMRWGNTAMKGISSQFPSIISIINMNLKVVTQ